MKKSPSHSSVKSNRTTSNRKDILIVVPADPIDLYIIPTLLETLLKLLAILVVISFTNLLTVENILLESGFGDLKETNLITL